MKESKPGVDTVLLRRALRLVHCLQKERGASCAYYVSRNEPSILGNMEKARVDCDRAIQMLLSTKGELRLHGTLMKIRTMVQMDHGDIEKNRHKILVCFNAFISSIVHDYFMQKVAAQQRSLYRRGSKGSVHGEDTRALKEQFGRHNRSRTMEDCCELGAMLAAVPDRGINTRTSSAPTDDPYLDTWQIPNLSPPRALPNSSPPRALPSPGEKQVIFPELGRGNNHGTGKASSYGNLCPGHRRYGSVDSPKRAQFQVPSTDNDPEMQIARLLNLLACFVKLKESTGVERAVLSSLVATGKEDSLFLSDLVLEVENQRRLLEELKKLPVGSMRNLVEELVEMSKPLNELQQNILKNFNLGEAISEGILKHDPDKNVIWELMTVYINKLHALELLIIEEIEYCLPAMDNGEHIHQSNALMESEFMASILGPNGSDEEVRTRLEKMPAEEIKEKLLSGLSFDRYDDRTNGTEIGHHNVSIATLNGEIEDPLLLIPNVPASKEWEINLYELKFLKRIGEGAAGTTYLANWTGLQVAVKVASITETGLDGWRTEVQALQKLHHPNVIRLLGSVYHPNPLTFCLVLEYCSGGDLNQAMKFPVAPGFFFKVAMGVANGIAYLHSRGIMHRDIKPENILCDGHVKNGNFQVKVSDFGVATETTILRDRTAETGTYRWMSPEVIRHESYSNMADVYSYAIVLWQLCTREDPYADISQIEAAGKVALERARPLFPEGIPEAVQSLINKCWAENAAERIPFEQLTEKLPALQKSLTASEHKWLDAPLGNPVYYPREEEIRDRDEDSNDHPPPPNLANHKKDRDEERKGKAGFFKLFGGKK